MYDESIKSLRLCADECEEDCEGCAYYKQGCMPKMMRDAADEIEELISRVPKWISVKENLPEESGGYLAYIHEPYMIQKADWEEQYDFSYVMELWFDKQRMLWSDNGEDSYNAYLPVVDTDNVFHVTHWMELPEPPKGE